MSSKRDMLNSKRIERLSRIELQSRGKKMLKGERMKGNKSLKMRESDVKSKIETGEIGSRRTRLSKKGGKRNITSHIRKSKKRESDTSVKSERDARLSGDSSNRIERLIGESSKRSKRKDLSNSERRRKSFKSNRWKGKLNGRHGRRNRQPLNRMRKLSKKKANRRQ